MMHVGSRVRHRRRTLIRQEARTRIRQEAIFNSKVNGSCDEKAGKSSRGISKITSSDADSNTDEKVCRNTRQDHKDDSVLTEIITTTSESEASSCEELDDKYTKVPETERTRDFEYW